MILTWLSTVALAGLGGPMDGLYAQGTVGVGSAGVALRCPADCRLDAAFTWDLALGLWSGRYDRDYSLGRSWGAGVRVQQSHVWQGGLTTVRTAPMLELRRTVDLLVVGVQIGVEGGPLFSSGATSPTRLAGGTARLVGGARYRFDWAWGAILRLEAGVDVVGRRVAPAIGLSVGLELSAPRGVARP